MIPQDSSLQQIIQATVLEVLAQLRRGVPVIPATMNLRQAAAFLGISPSKLSRLRSSGRGPPHLKVDSCIRFLTADLVTWLQEQRITNAKTGD